MNAGGRTRLSGAEHARRNIADCATGGFHVKERPRLQIRSFPSKWKAVRRAHMLTVGKAFLRCRLQHKFKRISNGKSAECRKKSKFIVLRNLLFPDQFSNLGPAHIGDTLREEARQVSRDVFFGWCDIRETWKRRETKPLKRF
jgi:hypothetical protein